MNPSQKRRRTTSLAEDSKDGAAAATCAMGVQLFVEAASGSVSHRPRAPTFSTTSTIEEDDPEIPCNGELREVAGSSIDSTKYIAHHTPKPLKEEVQSYNSILCLNIMCHIVSPAHIRR